MALARKSKSGRSGSARKAQSRTVRTGTGPAKSISQKTIEREASLVAVELKRRDARLVLAESCTGGMAAAALTGIPGISKFFCGSLVVYRDASKSGWLGIDPSLIEKNDAVSPETALAMALRALDITKEAEISASITGHLGPDAPAEQDGLIYIATAIRQASGAAWTEVHKLQLPLQPRLNAAQRVNSVRVTGLRRQRQMLASQQILRMVRALLTASGSKF